MGGSEQIEKRAETEKEGETRDETWRFEGRAWRTPGEQIMARFARSSRHGFREESSIRDGRTRREKKAVDTASASFPPTSFLFPPNPVLFRGDKSN